MLPTTQALLEVEEWWDAGVGFTTWILDRVGEDQGSYGLAGKLLARYGSLHRIQMRKYNPF